MLLKDARVYRGGSFFYADLRLWRGRISALAPGLEPRQGEPVFPLGGAAVFPGFVDVHVHLREPGFSYKETVAAGTLAAARGGYAAVCSMPNLSPPPDSADHLALQQEILDRDARVRVYPIGSITRGQRGEGALSDMAALAPRVKGFSDDGRGVNDPELMLKAMETAADLKRPILAHCEDTAFMEPGGCAHPGPFARRLGLPGIDPRSEWEPLRRDLDLVRLTGCRYHACHLSCRESVALMRAAKAEGLPVTCETAPHYLLLSQEQLSDHGRFRMNPPIRSREDRQALREGLADGTVDMVATDHAPHSAAEKDVPFARALMGVVGLDFAFPLMYRHLVEEGLLGLPALLERMAFAPARFLGLDWGLYEGGPANLCAWDLKAQGTVDPARFASLGRATPFEGWPLRGRCLLTVSEGRVAFDAREESNDG